MNAAATAPALSTAPPSGFTGYEYGNTRLRARRGDLLGASDYRELYLAGSADRMLGVLRATAYGPDVERALVHQDSLRRLDGSIRGHLVRSLGDVRRFYVGRPAEGVELLLGRWDLRNLLALVRSKANPAARAEFDSMLVPAGLLDAAALAGLAAQPSLRSTIELMVAWDIPSRSTARRLLRTWSRYESAGDPGVLEEVLAMAWAESLDVALRAWSGSGLDTVLQAEVDQVNLLASLRRRGQPAKRAGGHEVHLPGGRLGGRTLMRVQQAPTPADVLEALSEQRLGSRWMAALEEWAGDESLAALVGRLERSIARHAIGLFTSGDPLGISIPVAFVSAKECEARNVRLIGRAIVHQLDWSDIEQELFPW